MKLELNTDLEIGREVYWIDFSYSTLYKPCTACKNKRKITIPLAGEEFTIDCPKCTGRCIKGDVFNSMIMTKHSLKTATIRGFIFERESFGHLRWCAMTNKAFSFDVVTLEGRTAGGQIEFISMRRKLYPKSKG